MPTDTPAVLNASDLLRGGSPSLPARQRTLILTLAVVAAMTALRAGFAALTDLRTDEAYYWTWSKEATLSFLDHPPMVAWFIRAGTALFGDTDFGARFGGLVAMAAMQVFLADIVRRRTHDMRAVAFALLAPEATVYFGLMMGLVAPDQPLVLFVAAMLWALARLDEGRDPRWWLAAGAFGGLALLSKYTAAMLVPAVVVFVLWPPRNRQWLATPWPWAAAAIAVLMFSPVLAWNAQNGWASFAFQSARVTEGSAWRFARLGEFVGMQWGLIGPLMFPLLAAGAVRALASGWRGRDAVPILLGTAVVLPFGYFLWRAGWLRIGVTWPFVLWPAAFAATAVVLAGVLRDRGRAGCWATRLTLVVLGSGIGIVLTVYVYYAVTPRSLLGRADPIAQEAGYAAVADAAVAEMQKIGATWIATTDYRTYAMLRWHLRDRVPVVQVNERARFRGFRQPDAALIAGRPAVYVVPRRRMPVGFWKTTPDQRHMIRGLWRTWRGQRVERVFLQALTGFTPVLNPAPGTPSDVAAVYVSGPLRCVGIRCRAPY